MSYRDDSPVATAPPVARAAVDANWYYLDGQTKVGPQSFEAVEHLLRSGELDDDTLVWAPGMEDWRRARDVDELSEDTAGEPHPWRRWMARIIDYAVAAFIFGFVVAFVAPESTIFDNNITATLVVCAFWVIAEAFVQAWFGSTPGKALLNISVKHESGRSMKVDQALARSLRVWFFGMGVGLPLISLFTMARAHGRLRRDGTTSWDHKGNLVVDYNPLGAGRILGIVLVLLVIFALAVIPV